MLLDTTQDALAKELGVSFQQVQKYERGVNRVSATRLQQLADLLQCTTADLMPPVNGAKVDPETVSILELMQTRDGVKLAQAFKALPDNLRKAAVNVVEQMVPPQ